MYLLKNSFIVLTSFIISFITIVINNYLCIIKVTLNDFILINFYDNYINIIITIITLFLIYLFFSLLNYLINNKIFTYYYSFIIAFIIGSFHSYLIFQHNNNFNITNLIYIISLHIFISFFINLSSKYKTNRVGDLY